MSVDWLGQNPALPTPSIASSTYACHGVRTSGSSPKPAACRMSPDASTRRAPTRSMIGPSAIPVRSCATDEIAIAIPGGRDAEAAHVVQVDGEEREDDAVPERVHHAADLEQPDRPGKLRVQAAEVLAHERRSLPRA